MPAPAFESRRCPVCGAATEYLSPAGRIMLYGHDETHRAGRPSQPARLKPPESVRRAYDDDRDD